MATATIDTPKILRRFKSDKKCQVALGSLNYPFKRKKDKNNPESFENFEVNFISMENKVGEELIRWCEKTFDENFRIPDDIPGFVNETNPDGSVTRHQIGGMKVAEFLILTWEYRHGYLREDKEFHEFSRLKFLEVESIREKAEKAKSDLRIKELEAQLAKKEDKVLPKSVEKKVLGKVKEEIRK